MKIVTWNINSMKVRLPHLLRFLSEHAPDVVALQELKQIDADFPLDAITQAGYQAVWSLQKTYNGVAILSRSPVDAVETSFPTFPDEQKRVIAATIDGVRVINIYVPNGQSVGSDKYAYKLTWLNHLHDYLQQALKQYEKVVVLGDFNIAPEDRDVYDPVAWQDSVLCSAPERAALEKILSLGFVDTFRLFAQAPQTYSWWDYRTFAYSANRGLRIDLILASPACITHIQRCFVDPAPRGWDRPSDHAPVLLEIAV